MLHAMNLAIHELIRRITFHPRFPVISVLAPWTGAAVAIARWISVTGRRILHLLVPGQHHRRDVDRGLDVRAAFGWVLPDYQGMIRGDFLDGQRGRILRRWWPPGK